MGRGKSNLEYITKEKQRQLSLKKRTVGLVKKITEFTTLCDVHACMILCAPGEDCFVWPEDQSKVNFIIDKYKTKRKNCENISEYGLSDFLKDKTRKIEEELLKLQKRNQEAEFQSMDMNVDNLSLSELHQLDSLLIDRLNTVNSRIEMVRKLRENAYFINELEGNIMPGAIVPPLMHRNPSSAMSHFVDGSLFQPIDSSSWNSSFLGQRGVRLELLEPQPVFSFQPQELQQQHQQTDLMDNANSMMLMMMNGNTDTHFT